MKEFFKLLLIRLLGYFDIQVHAACGHKTKLRFVLPVIVKGKPKKATVFFSTLSPDHCSDCYKKEHVAECTSCKQTLFPGDEVFINPEKEGKFFCTDSFCAKQPGAKLPAILWFGKQVALD